MKVRMASIEDGVENLGFRKFSAYVRRLHPDADILLVPTGNRRRLLRLITMHWWIETTKEDIRKIAETLADSDLVGFSSMSLFQKTTKAIIKEIRSINPDTFILWGGIHPTVAPEDAIQYADAICIGEGEFAFERFYDAFSNERDYLNTPNFWFNTPEGVKQNPNLPLMTMEMMDTLPFPTYQDGERIYKKDEGFVPVQSKDFVDYIGVGYGTIWSIGCPFTCSYCSNSKFIKYDKDYRHIRYPSVDYMIAEIKRAKEKQPYIPTVIFHDDSFMALPHSVLADFAQRFKQEIGLPFAVYGLMPNYMNREKLEVLLEGGMNQVAMGIQSGSKRILDFYRRPTSVERIREAGEMLSRYSKYIIPPAYHLILDNPIERREDTLATLDLVYEMARPFALGFYSLRVIPNTELADDMEKLGIKTRDIRTTYEANCATFGNILLYVLSIWKIPRFAYRFLRKYVRPSHEPQRHFYAVLYVVRSLYLLKRGLEHTRFLDFTQSSGWFGYFLARRGFIQFWGRHMVRHFKRPARLEKEHGKAV